MPRRRLFAGTVAAADPNRRPKQMIIGVNIELEKTRSCNSRQGSPKPSEVTVFLEMGIALAAILGILALGVCIGYWANHDWISSIQRFQEMI
jgi:hypothetical protein